MSSTSIDSPHVVIIGAGNIGQAIAHLLRQAGHHTFDLWDADTSKVPHQKSCDEILPRADVVFLCVPSWTLRSALNMIAPCISSKTILVSISKGLEQRSCFTADQLIRDVLPRQPFAMLLGPMLAEEILHNKHASAVVSSRQRSVRQRVANLFEGSVLRCELHDDPHAVCQASVIKNVYALAMGIADGLEWGNNQKGRLACQSLHEMRLILSRVTDDPGILDSIAGTGDYLATAFSASSRNRQNGQSLIADGRMTIKSEGSVSFPSLLKLLSRKTNGLPILLTLKKIVMQNQGKNNKELFEKL